MKILECTLIVHQLVIVMLGTTMMALMLFVHLVLTNVKLVPISQINVTLVKIPELMMTVNVMMVIMMMDPIPNAMNVITDVKPVKEQLKLVHYVLETELLNQTVIVTHLDSIMLKVRSTVIHVTQDVNPVLIMKNVPFVLQEELPMMP